MPDWKKLFQNGQITWRTDERHKERLDHFYARSPDDALFESLYPGYLESRRPNELPVIDVPGGTDLPEAAELTEAPAIEGDVSTESAGTAAVEKPKKKSKKVSDSPAP